MSRSNEATLCLHGAIVMFAAFVSGGMIAAAALGQIDGSVDDWKLAHMEALINSIVLFAIAGVLGKLALSPGQGKVVAYCLVGMAYCNAVFGYMRGLTGSLGYEFDGSLANNITAFAGMLGVPLAVIAFALILLGAIRAGRSS
jgi:hypothetical protein